MVVMTIIVVLLMMVIVTVILMAVLVCFWCVSGDADGDDTNKVDRILFMIYIIVMMMIARLMVMLAPELH